MRSITNIPDTYHVPRHLNELQVSIFTNSKDSSEAVREAVANQHARDPAGGDV